MVTAVNDQTTVTNSTDIVNEDSSLIVDLTANATDIDGNTLTITSATAVNGTVVNGVYTPNANFNGTDTITYVINDSEEATVTIDVTAVNDVPVVNNAIEDMTFDEGDPKPISVWLDMDMNNVFSDADGDTLNYTVTIEYVEGTSDTYTLQEWTEELESQTPFENSDVGINTITWTATDPGGLSVSESYNVIINNINDAPVLNAINSSNILEGTTTGILEQASATDIDANSTITYSLSGVGAENFTIDPETGQLSIASTANIDYESNYNPVTRVAPVYNLTVTATDEHNATDTSSVEIAITDLRNSSPSSSFVTFWHDAPSGIDQEGNVGLFSIAPFTRDDAAPQVTAIAVIENEQLVSNEYYKDGIYVGYDTYVENEYDRTGSYALDNSTVYWAYRNDLTWTDLENNSISEHEVGLTILEDKPNDSL